MRFSTTLTATRRTAPTITKFQPPNLSFPPEVHISFGGLSVWLSEDEATALGERLIDAGARPVEQGDET